MDLTPPKLTKSELEQFLSRVKFWEKNDTPLSHIWFETDAINYVRNSGYGFELVRGNRESHYRVVKLK